MGLPRFARAALVALAGAVAAGCGSTYNAPAPSQQSGQLRTQGINVGFGYDTGLFALGTGLIPFGGIGVGSNFLPIASGFGIDRGLLPLGIGLVPFAGLGLGSDFVGISKGFGWDVSLGLLGTGLVPFAGLGLGSILYDP